MSEIKARLSSCVSESTIVWSSYHGWTIMDWFVAKRMNDKPLLIQWHSTIIDGWFVYYHDKLTIMLSWSINSLMK